MVQFKCAGLLLLFIGTTSVLAAPIQTGSRGVREDSLVRRANRRHGTGSRVRVCAGATTTVTVTVSATATASATASAATASATATATSADATTTDAATATDEEEGIVLVGVFDEATTLDAGDLLKVQYLTGSGKYEVEYENTVSNTVTVSQKTATGLAPSGFHFLDTNSFTVKLSDPTANATLLKSDYIFNTSSPLVAAVDITKSLVGRLDTTTNTFVVENVGELEFEDDEGEISLAVDDANGEWAVLAPHFAFTLVDEEGKEELHLNGTFDTVQQYPGGGVKADILFPANDIGSLEVEHNGTAPITVTVTAQTPSVRSVYNVDDGS
ncbi:hypothetical protein M422DRAFT_48900 [Sphaerobolus stellatus SS14]|uniref:Uncharacterized protein n=1 Tax=Sphaerobolus stellatus (strain SS14) TaxID=990650 RepID=A0A0C9VRZ1_SPHS4|nr:hypothetical protein M422DRAFT_48900 [Sphaerobolus stellatus SS14]